MVGERGMQPSEPHNAAHMHKMLRVAETYGELIDRLGGGQLLKLLLKLSQVRLGLLGGLLGRLECLAFALFNSGQRRLRVQRRVLEVRVRGLELVHDARRADRARVVCPVNRVGLLRGVLQLALEVLVLSASASVAMRQWARC